MIDSYKIWNIKGGVHPAFHKDESTQRPIIQPPLPEKLVVPMRQHVGISGRLLVKLGDTVYKGQVLTEYPEGLGSLTHAPTSGKIIDIGRYPVPHVSGFTCPGVTIEPDGKDDWDDQRLISYKDYASIDNDVLLQRIREAGVVGLGGAVFPSAVKISGSIKHELKTLIINGAECEPYITCDDVLMRANADEIVTGIQILLKMLTPEQCLVGIEDNKPEAIEAMQLAVKQVKASIQVVSIPVIYPSGDAKQLTKLLTGVEIPKGKRSYDMGSLCHNIATVHSVYKAVIEGEPLISRIVTVTGAGVKEPQNFNALLGTAFSYLISRAGGYTHKAERLIMGGPMMGYSMRTDGIPVVKATNCILVLPESDLPYSTSMAMPCIRCGKCAEVCPVDLLPQQLYWHARADDFKKSQSHHLFDCIECGCCSYVCPSNIPLVDYYRYAKNAVRAEQEKSLKTEQSRERHDFRKLRIQRDKDERDAKRAQYKAALQKKKAATKNKKNESTDVIKEAIERAKIKKEAIQKSPGNKPRNTENLTDSQKKQVEVANTRRSKQASADVDDTRQTDKE